ncbi:MuF-like minor capsid protein [Microbacterium phage Megan]|uniref:MuF-like minor capsid protein n=1 Tax=Microbacterium phage Megan TaxID=2656551 RepID=A0A649VJZ1_9CAUD|nr:MuF-like minor capsid protein [Microbacterium phage Megan]QGJ92686.1 MuF-like minor capsid protein [Microbacterium phage Megan]
MTENVRSAGAAFRRQARMEARVERVLSMQMRRFLADVEVLANSEGAYIQPPGVRALWDERMGARTLRQYLPDDVADYVASMQAESVAPGDAYDTVMAVVTASQEGVWAAQLTRDVLALALSMDTPPQVAVVTAAAPRRDSKRGRAMSEAFDKALGGKPGAISWQAAVKRDARTAVTGLDGIVSGATMRNEGVPFKQWVTRRDERVRHEHSAADGQRVPVDEPFMIGGYPAMHPGDRSLPARLSVNCRCVMIGADSPARGTTALPFLAP